MAKIGDIYWLKVEFTDKSDFKIRPIVIIDDKKDDIIYLPLTTNLNKGSLIIDLNDIEDGFIEKSSVDISKQCIIHKKFLLQKQATLNTRGLEKVLKALSFEQTKKYYKTIHKPQQKKEFIEGKSRVNYAGRVFDENEMINLIDSSLFVQKRKENFQKLYDGLKDIEEFILVEPQPNSDPSWFGFMITLKDGVKFSRNDLAEYLENHNIQTRNLFAGNMLRHPMFESLEEDKDYRVIGDLKNTDKIMNDSFWVGVYPSMSDEAIEYIVKKTKEFINKFY